MGRWIAWCVHRHRLVLVLALMLSAGAVWAIATRLSVSTDTGSLFSASLPWRARTAVLQKAFPQNEDLLVAVVDADTPEQAEATAAALATRLRPDTRHFRSVRQPDVSPYFERNGLLFLEPGPLATLLDQTVDAQPFLGQLARDPSLRGLMSALSLIAQGVEAGQANLAPFEPSLKAFDTALAAAAAGNTRPLSWQRLLAGSVSELGGKYHFVLVKPVLDYGALEPGAAASATVRAAIKDLEFVRDGSARVRLTGSVALEDEEFATVAAGAGVGVVGSMALVALLLFLAVRSWRLIVPILVTLVLGLLLTTAFAALVVGTLNLVSVAFAVLFVGIAVDFAIQVTVRFRDIREHVPDLQSALEQTGRRTGRQVLVAALASMAGFLAFTPTSFVGVAQLGLIAGSGMLIAFVCTVSALPALLAALRPTGGAAETGLGWLRPLDPFLQRWHRPVVLGFGVLALAGLALLPRLGFDSDPLHTKNRSTEAMQTLYALIDDPIANPYTIDVLMPSLPAAATLAPRLAKLSLVDQVLTLSSFVPDDQNAKLPLIQDAASLLRTTLDVEGTVPPPDATAIRTAITQTAAALDAVRTRLPSDSTVLRIIADLQTLSKASDTVLLAANAALTRFLPLQLDRLRTALAATAVTEADVPASIRDEWLLPDGRAKLQVVPKPEARDSAGLHRFVDQVETVAPEAAGSAVTITASADTVVEAFRTAAVLALGAIAVLLVLGLRRVVDVLLVLTPLLVSTLLTVLLAVLLPLPLNFANIIALPLLLGVGVSFNVYFVMNWRRGETGPAGSATARAVLFSGLTTATAFGSLAISAHPGTASMGHLLLLSLGCTLLTTILLLPALLAWVGPPRTGRAR